MNEVFILKKYDLKDKNANYTRQFVCHEDIDELWKDDRHKFICFRLLATDSLTGFSKVFEREYRLKRNSIKEGTYESGDSFKIL